MRVLDPTGDRRLKASLARLASNHDGEVIAAVAAIGRILGKAGLGFSDLGVAPALAPQSQSTPPPSNPWRPRARRFETEPLRAHQQHARRCLGSSLVAWKPHERRFLEQMAEQLRKPSEAQNAWLEGLVDRLARKAREACNGADF